jgi:hypothetical protein
LINTIVAQIRTIFKNNNSVLVTAPTGAAGHKIGGQKNHHEFKISVKKKKGLSLSNSAKEHLIQKLSQTVVLIFNKQSMISQRVLRSAEINVRTTAHGGEHSNEDWGGIPIVVILGDNYQLTPPCEEGAIDSFHNQGNSEESKNGAYHFINLGQCSNELSTIMRQDESQMELRDILKNTRIGEPSENYIKSLMPLHLNSGNLSIEQIQAIEDHALYIFANKKLMKEHNRERLCQQHSVTIQLPD